MAALRAMTADELLQYRHEPYRTELIAGRLVKMGPGGGTHGCGRGADLRPTAAHVRAQGLGTAFGAGTGVPAGFWLGPPDVAFEVTSPGDRRGEVESKARSWLDAGTSAVVIIDPTRRGVTSTGRTHRSRAWSGRSDSSSTRPARLRPEGRRAVRIASH